MHFFCSRALARSVVACCGLAPRVVPQAESGNASEGGCGCTHRWGMLKCFVSDPCISIPLQVSRSSSYKLITGGSH